MVYSYYDWLSDYYAYWEEYYEDYYESHYWPIYYGVYNISNDSWCDFIHEHNITHNATHFNPSEFEHALNTTGTEAPFLPTNTYLDTTLYSTGYDNTAYDMNLSSTLFNCTPRYNGTFPPSGYEWEMWWTQTIDTIGMIQVPICSVLATCAIAVSILFFVQLKASLHLKNRPDRFTIFLSTVCMISHSIYATGDIFLYYFWYWDYSWTRYTQAEAVWEFFWLCGKISIYSLFAYRYYILQNASIENPATRRSKVLLFGTIIACICIQIVLETLYAVYRLDYLTTGWDDPNYREKRRFYLNAAWAVMGMDFVLVLFLGVCIMRTILRLVLTMNDPSRVKMTASKHGLTEASKTYPSQFSVTSPSADAAGATHVEMSGTNDQQEKDTADAMKKQTHKRKKFSIGSLSKRAEQTMTEERQKRTSKQINLMEVTTRIALTCSLSLVSSFLVQLSAYIVEETENWTMQWVSWFWGVDALTNMCCVYFSMAFAKQHYMKVCADCCKCHHCCLWCIMKLVNHAVAKKRKKAEKVAAQSARIDDAVDVTDIAPQLDQDVIQSPSSPSASTDAVL